MASGATRYHPTEVSPPGATILELLEERGLTQAEFAARMQRPAKMINDLVHGRQQLTPETAIQLESTLGAPASFWLAREAKFREFLAREHRDTQLAGDVAWLDELPIRSMRKLGWISDVSNPIELVKSCLGFFGVACVDAWRRGYEQPIAAFRTSKSVRSSPGAVAAWLRRSEVSARRLHCAAYDAGRFRDALKSIRPLSREHDPAVFVPEIQRLCCAAGVAVVFEPSPAGCRASGVTQWLTPESAMMALSLRHKTDDHLWFTLVHEAGHILLHGKKALFVEEGSGGELEAEADAFASEWLIPKSHVEDLKRLKSHADVTEFAKGIGISEGAVVGRLQHDGLIPWRSPLNSLKVSFRWQHEIE